MFKISFLILMFYPDPEFVLIIVKLVWLSCACYVSLILMSNEILCRLSLCGFMSIFFTLSLLSF